MYSQKTGQESMADGTKGQEITFKAGYPVEDKEYAQKIGFYRARWSATRINVWGNFCSYILLMTDMRR